MYIIIKKVYNSEICTKMKKQKDLSPQKIQYNNYPVS